MRMIVRSLVIDGDNLCHDHLQVVVNAQGLKCIDATFRYIHFFVFCYVLLNFGINFQY
jgi:hypothetical protein